MNALLALDLLLVAAVGLTGLGVLFVRELFPAIVLFVVFGLLLALAWVRLEAPDVALAEAAVGAGLTGVFLLDTFAFARRRGSP